MMMSHVLFNQERMAVSKDSEGALIRGALNRVYCFVYRWMGLYLEGRISGVREGF